jgi:hypothetical protein
MSETARLGRCARKMWDGLLAAALDDCDAGVSTPG